MTVPPTIGVPPRGVHLEGQQSEWHDGRRPFFPEAPGAALNEDAAGGAAGGEVPSLAQSPAAIE